MSLDRLELEIAEDEGWRAKPYQDSVGVWTVGYGFNLESRPMPESVGRYWMREILIECVADLEEFPFWALANEARRHAFVNMRYNLGGAGFRQFQNMIGAANRGDWMAAAAHARDSRWFRQVGRRGPRVCDAIETGEHR